MESEKISTQKETLAFLSNKYPNCFTVEGKVKPLKIGIFQDIANDLEDDQVLSKRLLRLSLRHYTSSWRYLSAIKEGVARVDLKGEEGDAVEQQHAEHAAEQLKESKAKAAKNRALKAKDSKPVPKHKGYEKEAAVGDKARSKETKPASHGAKRKSADRNTGKENKASHQKAQVPITSDEILVGQSALVKLGKEPMPVTITDVSKDGISVQLKSGMTVKVQTAQLFSAAKSDNK